MNIFILLVAYNACFNTTVNYQYDFIAETSPIMTCEKTIYSHKVLSQWSVNNILAVSESVNNESMKPVIKGTEKMCNSKKKEAE